MGAGAKGGPQLQWVEFLLTLPSSSYYHYLPRVTSTLFPLPSPLPQNAGVPTVPGSEGLIRDDADAVANAQRIGFPVMIKATAGGGGGEGLKGVDGWRSVGRQS